MRNKENKKVILFSFGAIFFLALFYISGIRTVLVSAFTRVLAPIVGHAPGFSSSSQNTQIKVLEEEIGKLRQENSELTDKLSISQTLLKDASGLGQYKADKKIAAKILWFNLFPGSRIVHVNKGTNDGVANNMAVVAAGGILVGKTINVSKDTADILLIDDPSFKVSVEIDGIIGLMTTGADNKLNISMVGADSHIEPGVIVKTAGQGDSLPKDLIIGRVSEASLNGAEPFLKIKVESLADINTQDYIFIINAE